MSPQGERVDVAIRMWHAHKNSHHLGADETCPYCRTYGALADTHTFDPETRTYYPKETDNE